MMLKTVTGALCSLAALGVAQAAPQAAYYQKPAACHCPKGYDLIKNTCVAEETHPKIATCPFNKYGGAGDCMKPVAPELSCPADFNYVPKVGCVQADETDPNYVCPKGFFVDGTVCTRSFEVPPIPECPEGQFLENGQCVNIKTHPAQAECQGFDRKGKCFLAQTGNSALECPVGFKLVGDRCEKVEFANKVYVCHWHYNRIFDKDEEDLHPTKKCPRIVNVPCGKNHYHHKRRLAPEDEEMAVEEAGVVSPKGRHGYTGLALHQGHSKNQCTKTEYYPARGRCPRGYTPLDGEAQKYMSYHHYDKKQKPDCYKVEVVAPEIVCLDRLVRRKCTKVVQIPFNLECNYDSFNGFSRVGKKCVKIVERDPTETCPPNTTGPPCMKTRTIPAKKQCPTGYERKHGKCVQLTIVKPSLCPSLAIEKNGQCFVKVPAVFQCPKGYEPSPEHPKECVTLKKRPAICPHHKHTGYANQYYGQY